MTLTIIAAIAHKGAIGRGGDLLFHISDDLRRFKQLTMGKPIIMGRKTFESFPNGALAGRRNMVITRKPNYNAAGIETYESLDVAISALDDDVDEAFVIGGGQVYREAIDLADRLELTIIDADVADADTYFPRFDTTEWELVDASADHIDPKSGVSYRFVRYEAI